MPFDDVVDGVLDNIEVAGDPTMLTRALESLD